jgi:hypothetical protein
LRPFCSEPRSAHQIKFHSAFERCVSRVVYKKDWATARPAIMRHNKWDRCSSEVMIRRAPPPPRPPPRATTHSSRSNATLAARRDVS